MSDTAAPVKKTRTEIQRASKQRWYIKNREALKARAIERYYANHELNREQAKQRGRSMKARLLELETIVAQIKNVPEA